MWRASRLSPGEANSQHLSIFRHVQARSVLEGFEELSEKQTSDTSLADRKGKEEAEPVSDSWLPDSDFGLEAQSKYIKASKGPRVVTDLVDITSDIDVSMMELNEGAGKGKGKAIESALTDRKNAEPSDIDDFIPCESPRPSLITSESRADTVNIIILIVSLIVLKLFLTRIVVFVWKLCPSRSIRSLQP